MKRHLAFVLATFSIALFCVFACESPSSVQSHAAAIARQDATFAVDGASPRRAVDGASPRLGARLELDATLALDGTPHDATIEDARSMEQRLAELEHRNALLEKLFGTLWRGSSGPRHAAGPGFTATGEQRFQLYTRLLEAAKDWTSSSIPASTWTTIYTMPASVVGQLSMVAALAVLSYDNSDAAVNCDSGMCDTVVRHWAPGRYQGGDFCRPDAVCANSVAGGDFSVKEDTFTPPSASAVMFGALTRMQLVGASIVLQVNCPTTCRAAGGISSQLMMPFAVVDAGPIDAGPPAVLSISPSSGPATGGTAVIVTVNHGMTGSTAASLDTVACTGFSVTNDTTATCTSAAGSAGTGAVHVANATTITDLAGGWTYSAGPTITSLTVPMGAASGGEVIPIVGTGLTSPTACTIGGIAGTVAGVDATHANCTSPAGLVSSSTPVAVTITTAAGTGTLASSFYVHAGSPVVFFFPGIWSLSGSTITSWLNQASGGANPAVPTGSPTFTAAWNASAFPAVTMSGSQWFTSSFGARTRPNTECIAFSTSTPTATLVFTDNTSSSPNILEMYIASSKYGIAGAIAPATSGTTDTNSHVMCAVWNGVSSIMDIDGADVTGLNIGASDAVGWVLGTSYNHIDVLVGALGAGIFWNAALSQADVDIFAANAKAVLKTH